MKEYWKPKKTNQNFRTKCQWVCKLFVPSQQQKKQKRSEWPSQRGGCWNVCSTWFWWCYFQPMLNNMFDTTLKSLSIPVAVVRFIPVYFLLFYYPLLYFPFFIQTNYPSQTKFFVFFLTFFCLQSSLTWCFFLKCPTVTLWLFVERKTKVVLLVLIPCFAVIQHSFK